MRLLLLIVLFAIPSFAQNDFVGEWAARYHEDQTERIAGPDIGDYLGIPLNDAARLRADSWDASILTLPEWQCRPHPADYGTRGPANLRVWKDVDPATQQVMSYHTHVQWQAQERTIWMDGRPHPVADAPHTWQGFSTGKWEGNQLTVITTHLKESYVRRNGVPRSDRATLIEHWIRHGDYLTLVSIINDPVYLAEPFIRTTNWAFDPGQAMEPYPCEVAEEIQRPEGVIPHHLPGENAFLPEFPRKIGIPEQAARGGADTMYPEYIAKMHNPSLAVVAAPAAPASASGPAEIHVQRVRGDIYMLSGAGGNITIQIGNDGVLLVDAGLADMTGRVLEEVKKLSTRPVRYIVDTHVHADHIGGNERIAKQGQTIAGGDVARLATDATEGAAILAHQNVMNRMTGSQPPAPFAALPTDTYLGAKKEFFSNGEALQILHLAAAHTDGDSIVFFRRSDVISTGDIFTTTGYPFIDLARGGGIQGEIDALNRILDLAIPAGKEEGGTYIVPGHGRLCDEADVAYYRDMVTIIRDRILNLKKKGMTLEQVKEARPTSDYDPRYGSAERFIEAVYQSLR